MQRFNVSGGEQACQLCALLAARTAAAGFDLHLTKPATLEAIQEVLAQV